MSLIRLLQNIFICLVYLFFFFEITKWNYYQHIRNDLLYIKTLCQLVFIDSSNCFQNHNVQVKTSLYINNKSISSNNSKDIYIHTKKQSLFCKNIRIIVKYNISSIQYRHAYIFMDYIYDKNEYNKILLRYHINYKKEGYFSCYYDHDDPENVFEKIPRWNIFWSFLFFLFNIFYVFVGLLLFYFLFIRRKFFLRFFPSKNDDNYKIFNV